MSEYGRYEAHDAAKLFPLDEGNIPKLANDIRRHGLRVPIELFDGKIIDGRRRFRACMRAGVNPEFRTVELDDPVAYVLSLNILRRHLTVPEIAVIREQAYAYLDRKKREPGCKPGALGRAEETLGKIKVNATTARVAKAVVEAVPAAVCDRIARGEAKLYEIAAGEGIVTRKPRHADIVRQVKDAIATLEKARAKRKWDLVSDAIVALSDIIQPKIQSAT